MEASGNQALADQHARLLAELKSSSGWRLGSMRPRRLGMPRSMGPMHSAGQALGVLVGWTGAARE